MHYLPTRRQFLGSTCAGLATTFIPSKNTLAEPGQTVNRAAEPKPAFTKFRHLIVRGDEACWARDNSGGYPFVVLAAGAGATGLLAWAKASSETLKAYINYCHDLGLTVHTGIGVGGYGVEEGRDPREPGVLRRINDHISQTLDAHNFDGIEFQTGEYDATYTDADARGNAWARKLVDSLNPVIDHALSLKKSLWIRTELHTGHFTGDNMRIVSQNLDRRCTVEWSLYTGPFEGDQDVETARSVLAMDPRFSWFLKTQFYGISFWHQTIVGREAAKDYLVKNRPKAGEKRAFLLPPMNAAGMRLWIAEWRKWINLLREARRDTLTICHCPPQMPAPATSNLILEAAVALAGTPDLSEREALSLLGLSAS